jgi:hypothetical protein
MRKQLYKWRSNLIRLLKPEQYLPNAANTCRLEKLRDIHKGKRAFILGNGPSLTVEDMNLLKDEITFASNKIYLAYDQTDWRPTYLTCTDTIVARNNRETLLAQPEVKLFGHALFPEFRGCKDIVFCNYSKSKETAQKWDLVDGVSTGHSVVYWDLELAYWMGIREVYVLGLDHSFDVKSAKTGEKAMGNEVIKAADEKNHFHPDYRKPGETWTMPKMDLLREDFIVALEKFQSDGGTIVNVSRTTKLDVWPTARLEDIL